MRGHPKSRETRSRAPASHPLYATQCQTSAPHRTGLTRLVRLDLDAPRPSLLGLGDPHGEDAVMQVGFNLVLVHCPGQGDAVLEVPSPPGSAPETAPPLPLHDVAGDDQLVIAQLDVDVVALDSGHLGFDNPGVVRLLDVSKR